MAAEQDRAGAGPDAPAPAGDAGDVARACASCGQAPAGPGGVVCPQCRTALGKRARPGGSGGQGDEAGADRAVALRAAARLYLDHGLLPVPAWGVRPGGECCCHRGAGCRRPGKHPRSVHVGPGEHDYSWKPLACATGAEIEERFADGGEFAAGNLMLAIPAGMLVIDQDDDDGGRQAAAALAEQLGELPDTLAHRTPHGVHRIYRTPLGWTSRAWVGKDARNPLPAGIDLRVPGQILMAPPSRVPAGGLLAGYGPTAGTEVAQLPAAYVTAWTPRSEPSRGPRPVMPVPAGRADVAAAYVHARIAGIVGDLADLEPGGRNTAIYTAALKVGSTMGAARSTPGAETAAAGWPDEAAEAALMAAAERNGYVAAHSAAAARSAIRSGLRNGLRSPRPLPGFGSRPASQFRQRGRAPQRAEPAASEQATDQPAAAGRPPAEGARHSLAGTAPSADVSRRDGPAGSAADERKGVAAALQAAGFMPGGRERGSPGGPEGFLAGHSPDGRVVVRHAAVAGPVGGVPPWDRADQMLDRYARTLSRSGYDVTRSGPGSLTVRGLSGRLNAAHRSGHGDTEPDNRTLADRAASAANTAYRAGDLDRARALTEQAATLDPARADLWQQHRAEIEARGMLRQARAARADGDQARVQELVEDAARLDPRMTSLWDQDLPGLQGGRHEHSACDHTGPGPTRDGLGGESALSRDCGATAQPRGPEQPAVLHHSHAVHGHSRGPQAAQSGDTDATPGGRRPLVGRQPGPDPDTRPHQGQRAVVRATSPDWRDAVADGERGRWQPKVLAVNPELALPAEHSDAEING